MLLTLYSIYSSQGYNFLIPHNNDTDENRQLETMNRDDVIVIDKNSTAAMIFESPKYQQKLQARNRKTDANLTSMWNIFNGLNECVETAKKVFGPTGLPRQMQRATLQNDFTTRLIRKSTHKKTKQLIEKVAELLGADFLAYDSTVAVKILSQLDSAVQQTNNKSALYLLNAVERFGDGRLQSNPTTVICVLRMCNSNSTVGQCLILLMRDHYEMPIYVFDILCNASSKVLSRYLSSFVENENGSGAVVLGDVSSSFNKQMSLMFPEVVSFVLMHLMFYSCQCSTFIC